MLEQGLRILSSLFIGAWLARYLGPSDYGLFSYLLAIMVICGAIARVGLDGIVEREIIQLPHKKEEILGSALVLRIIAAVIATAFMVITVLLTRVDYGHLYLILILGLSLSFQSFDVVVQYFMSQVKAKVLTLARIIQLSFSALLKIYLILVGCDLKWFVAAVAFDAAVLACLLMVIYRHDNPEAFLFKGNLNTGIKLLSEAWPMIFSSLASMLYMKIDQVMIGFYLDDYSVGVYSAATKLTEAIYFLPNLVCASVFPALVSAKSRADKSFEDNLVLLYRTLLMLAIPIAILISIFAANIVTLVFGDSYNQSSSVLQIYSIAFILVTIGVVSSKYMTIEKLQKLMFVSTILGMAVNISLNIILIPRFGIEGAAYATVISYVVINILFLLNFPQTRRLLVIIGRSFGAKM